MSRKPVNKLLLMSEDGSYFTVKEDVHGSSLTYEIFESGSVSCIRKSDSAFSISANAARAMALGLIRLANELDRRNGDHD